MSQRLTEFSIATNNQRPETRAEKLRHAAGKVCYEFSDEHEPEQAWTAWRGGQHHCGVVCCGATKDEAIQKLLTWEKQNENHG